ncbi:hypothetical protein RQN30_10025 [Arcanobacterium hippocoleae]
MPRTRALAAEGKYTALVGIGLVFILLISGLIEGFITPANLPWPGKIFIGTLAFAAVVFWFMYFGRKAAKQESSLRETVSEIGWTVEYA